MKKLCVLAAALVALFAVSGALSVAPARSGKALWIEFRENGTRTATIAVTERLAREFLNSRDLNLHISQREKKDLLTREMLLAVLDGDQNDVETSDPETGTTARVYLQELNSPARGDGTDRLVLETYKAGARKFRIALPDVELEQADDEGESTELVKTCLGWKELLPFLAKNGGAVYVESVKDDTEVWVYVE